MIVQARRQTHNLSGINTAGDVVGSCSASGNSNAFKFTAATRQFTMLSFPGAYSTSATGINDSGQIVGWYSDGHIHHGFLLSSGNYTTIDQLGSGVAYTTPNGINNNGQIVGWWSDTAGAIHGFFATKAQLVDPVPNLVSGNAVLPVSTSAAALATQGRTVQGVAADGVTEVIVEIPANNVGDQFVLTVLNDSTQQQSDLPNEDGALGNPGDTSFSQTQLAVTAVATSSSGSPNPMAFAIYRAPIDFARPVSGGGYKLGTCNGVSMMDDGAGCRTVTITAQSQTTGAITNIPVLILRPPVVLVHGLWGDPSDWNYFSPLYSDLGGPNPRFYVGLVTYNKPLSAPILSSTPDYSNLPAGTGTNVLLTASSNSLGFQYNAPDVLKQIRLHVQVLGGGTNAIGLPVASVQADIVAHSMGGDISRTLPLITNSSLGITVVGGPDDFFTNTFGQGSIHKLITIDTPHLGSPLATQLLNGQNGCVAKLLASKGKPAFASVQVAVGGLAALAIPAAVGDLVDSPPSQALQNIAVSGQHALPTALIAGTANVTNFAGLGTDPAALTLHSTCGTIFRNPLALNLDPMDWPSVFGGESNDAIVGLASELNGLNPDPFAVFDGNVHSPGTEKLGFLGPSVMDAGPVPTQVINLLNTPITTTIFHLLNP